MSTIFVFRQRFKKFFENERFSLHVLSGVAEGKKQRGNGTTTL